MVAKYIDKEKLIEAISKRNEELPRHIFFEGLKEAIKIIECFPETRSTYEGKYAKEAVNNDAYLHSCKCPTCGQHITRGSEESYEYCSSCGEYLHIPAFSDAEIKDSIFRSEMDDYED